MCISQAEGGDTTPPVGLDSREQVAGAGSPMCGAIGGQCRFDRESVGRDSSSQSFVGDVLDRATGSQKQPLDMGHGQQRADAHRTSRLAKDGDVLWIATKGGDVLSYPLEGSDLVEQGAVGVSLAQREKAVDTYTVIDGHAHDAVAGETT